MMKGQEMGNQPQMRAPDANDGNSVPFKFVKCTNLKSGSAAYMHDFVYTFVDADHLKTAWTLYANGKPTGSAEFVLARKKSS